MRSIVRHIHLKIWVFATSNGTKKLSQPLLSRFRVLYLNKYDCSVVSYYNVACWSCTNLVGVDKELQLLAIVSTRFSCPVTKDIRYCVL
jgi:hypothetical protein